MVAMARKNAAAVKVSTEVLVPKEISEALVKVERRLTSIGPEELGVNRLYEPAVHLLKQPGKLFRSGLILSSALTLGLDLNQFIELCAGIEVLHVSSLILDDVIDQDRVRRGIPAVHVVYGRNTADLAMVADIALSIRISLPYGQGVVGNASRAASDMAEGQHLDAEYQSKEAVPTRSAYMEIIRLKTASLMAVAASAPATYAGDRSAERTLYEIGYNMGFSFQLKNDILNVLHAEQSSAGQNPDKTTFRPNIVAVFANEGATNPLEHAIRLNNRYVSEARKHLRDLKKPETFEAYLDFLDIKQ